MNFITKHTPSFTEITVYGADEDLELRLTEFCQHNDYNCLGFIRYQDNSIQGLFPGPGWSAVEYWLLNEQLRISNQSVTAECSWMKDNLRIPNHTPLSPRSMYSATSLSE